MCLRLVCLWLVKMFVALLSFVSLLWVCRLFIGFVVMLPCGFILCFWFAYLLFLLLVVCVVCGLRCGLICLWLTYFMF